MKTRDTTEADLAYVLERLCPMHRAEHAALGFDHETALAKARFFLSRGHSVTVEIDGQPACVFGAFPDLGVNTTWMIATDAYFGAGVPAILHARRYLRNLVKHIGPLLTSTLSPHPDVGRWLELIGYRKEAQEGDLQIFSYT